MNNSSIQRMTRSLGSGYGRIELIAAVVAQQQARLPCPFDIEGQVGVFADGGKQLETGQQLVHYRRAIRHG